MSPEDARHVLAVAASYDNRPPSQAVATAWAYDLGDTTRTEAVEAVREHYRTRPDDWIKPGHVLEIVKRYRRSGLEQSSRVEHAALRAIDPDDPAYTERVIETIQDARHRAASDPAAIPAHVALPSRPEEPSERAQRAHRGAARVRAALAEARKNAAAVDRPEPTEAELKHERLLAAAAEHKTRRGGGPGSLTEAGARFLTQTIPDRKDHR